MKIIFPSLPIFIPFVIAFVKMNRFTTRLGMNATLVRGVGSEKSASITTVKVTRNTGGITQEEEIIPIIPIPDLIKEEMEDNVEEAQIDDREEGEVDQIPVLQEVQILGKGILINLLKLNMKKMKLLTLLNLQWEKSN